MVKLTENERKVFAAFQVNAAASIAEIAKECDLNERVVRYSMESLVKRSLLQTSLLIDESKMGLRHIKLLLNLQIPHGKSLESVEKTILSLPSVAWLTRTAGEYTHHIALWVWSFSDVERFFDLLTKRVGPVVTRKLMAEGRGWEFYGKKDGYPLRQPTPILRTGLATERIPLEPFDYDLIGEMAMRPLASLRDLAQALARPASSIRYRISRLTELGVIGAPLIRIRVDSTDFVAFFAQIKVKYPSATFNRALHAFSAPHPNIIELCNCFGAWDFEMRLEAEQPAAISKTVSELTTRFSDHIESILLLPRFADLAWNFDIRPTLRSLATSITPSR